MLFHIYAYRFRLHLVGRLQMLYTDTDSSIVQQRIGLVTIHYTLQN